MKRRHCGIAWNMKKHRLRPDPMPNVGISRNSMNRLSKNFPWVAQSIRKATTAFISFLKKLIEAIKKAATAMVTFTKEFLERRARQDEQVRTIRELKLVELGVGYGNPWGGVIEARVRDDDGTD